MTMLNQNAIPKIAGIVNITVDSFSDGGQFLSPDAAITRAKQVLSDGASIVELGPASSHPDSQSVSAETQIERLKPLFQYWPTPEDISVDCTLPSVQLYALKQGVGYINDIQGFPNEAVYPQFADSDCQLIIMHSISTGELASREDVPVNEILGRIWQFFDQRIEALTRAGIAPNRLIIDPGMGFFLGTNPETSLHVLRSLPEMKARYGLPLMISVSRKSFLQKTANVDVNNAASATLAAELASAELGADFIRTHEVGALCAALKTWHALKSPKKKGP